MPDVGQTNGVVSMSALTYTSKPMAQVQTGLDILLQNPQQWLHRQRVGLLCNHTAVDQKMRHAITRLKAHPECLLRRLFAPEHGLWGVEQYMVDVQHEVDSQSGLPVVSLYGDRAETLHPSHEVLQDLDGILIDFQDIGTRYYTYAATMAFMMQAAGRAGKRVIVLDRPNPIDGITIEGGGIEKGLESFVGAFSMPQRHGLTLGELARIYKHTYGIECELEVIACQGWRREEYYDETKLPWVMPSPNMPTLDTAIVYPGMCLLEGTNISEGRGTTRPFEIFGAPYIRSEILKEALASYDIQGAFLRSCMFLPTFQKYKDERCEGLQIHVTSRKDFRPYRTGLAIVHAIKKLWPKAFAWRDDAYEFRDDVPAFDLLTGNASIRKAIDQQAPFSEITDRMQFGATEFTRNRQDVLLY